MPLTFHVDNLKFHFFPSLVVDWLLKSNLLTLGMVFFLVSKGFFLGAVFLVIFPSFLAESVVLQEMRVKYYVKKYFKKFQQE